MAINFNGQGNPKNIKYNGNPVYLVKRASDNQVMWAKPYIVKELPAAMSATLKGSPSSTDIIAGERGYIEVSGSYADYSSTNYVFYSNATIPGNATLSSKSTIDNGANTNICYLNNIPILIIEGTASPGLFDYKWESNILKVSFYPSGGPDAKITLILGTRTSTTGNISFNLNIDYNLSYPNDSYTWIYAGNSTYYISNNPSTISMIIKTIQHFIILNPTTDVWVEDTIEPTAVCRTTFIGDTVYYGDSLLDELGGGMITIGDDISPGTSDYFEWKDRNLNYTAFSDGGSDSDYISVACPTNSPMLCEGTFQTTYYSSPTSSASTQTKTLRKVPIIGGNEITFNSPSTLWTTSKATFNYWVGDLKNTYALNIRNPDLPSSLSTPVLAGEMTIYELNGNRTSYETYLYVKITNNNNVAVQVYWDCESNMGDHYVSNATINANSYISRTFSFDEYAQTCTLDVYFKSLGMTSSSAYAEYGSTG